MMKARASKLKPSSLFNRRNSIIITLLIVAALALSIGSYEYSNEVSSNAATLSLNSIHSNTQIEASDLSNLLQKSLLEASSNLNVIAHSNGVMSQNLTAASPLFSAAQNSTSSLTSAYYWLDQNGILILVNNGTSTMIYPPGTGPNLSQRPTFTFPKDTGITYYSSATPSITNSSVEYIFISVPLFSNHNGTNSFSGVVATAIDLNTLGSSLRQDLSPIFQSSIGILDFKGTILYGSNKSQIGQNVFSNAIQKNIPAGFRSEFDSFLNQSLKGQSGYEDITFNNIGATLAYQPVDVTVTNSSGAQFSQQFGVLYVVAANSLATNAAALIGQERLVTLIIILGIAGVSGTFAFITLRWNRRLDELIDQRTSDLVSANENLAAKSMAEKDLLNITAHELRTPTQSVLANSELLRKVIGPALGIKVSVDSANADPQMSDKLIASDIQPIEILNMVDSTYRNARRLQKLTQNILEVVRIDNRTFQLEKEEFDLNDLVKQSIEDSKSSLARYGGDHRKIDIFFESRQPTLLVYADRTKVGEIVSNLLDNAVRYSNNSGKIEITTDQDANGFAVVRVKDNGPGIDPSIQPKLFGKFATKSGTGLGLFICKSYVEAHGGRIEATNKGEKRGATFTFTLPLAGSRALERDEKGNPVLHIGQ
jgi:signal transduction histidine kinase